MILANALVINGFVFNFLMEEFRRPFVMGQLKMRWLNNSV